MRHRRAGRRLNRSGAHRRALFRNLVRALFEHETIRTTDAKAKELRRWADRMVTLGKRGDLAARRRAAAFLGQSEALRRLFAEIAPRFRSRAGGYTRVIKIGPRGGDAAPLSVVELTERASGAEKGGRERAKRPARRGGDAPSRSRAAKGG